MGKSTVIPSPIVNSHGPRPSDVSLPTGVVFLTRCVFLLCSDSHQFVDFCDCSNEGTVKLFYLKLGFPLGKMAAETTEIFQTPYKEAAMSEALSGQTNQLSCSGSGSVQDVVRCRLSTLTQK